MGPIDLPSAHGRIPRLRSAMPFCGYRSARHCATQDNAPASGDIYLFECPNQDNRDRIAASSVTYSQQLPLDAIRAVRAKAKA